MSHTSALDRRQLGGHGPVVTRIGLGGAPLGNLFSVVSDDQVEATIQAAWDHGIRFFDTAPLYGSGLSERRLGRALVAHPRDEYVLATKVGRLLRPVDGAGPDVIFAAAPPLTPVRDYSRDGTLRSIAESLERLGVDRLDVVHVHDPDDHETEAMTGALPTLIDLREEGVIGAVGCGMNQWEMLHRLAQRVDLDCVLLAGRYTLIDRTGTDLLDLCSARKIGVILGGIFNSGLLADPDGPATFDYAPATTGNLDKARSMRDMCERSGTTLPAAAIHFALRHPAVTSIVIGARSPTEINADVEAATAAVPQSLWPLLDTLADA